MTDTTEKVRIFVSWTTPQKSAAGTYSVRKEDYNSDHLLQLVEAVIKKEHGLDNAQILALNLLPLV